MLRGDPFIGGGLPRRGGYHVLQQLFVASIQLGPRAMGKGEGELLRPAVVPLQFLPPPKRK
jgi:hypothetical protein